MRTWVDVTSALSGVPVEPGGVGRLFPHSHAVFLGGAAVPCWVCLFVCFCFGQDVTRPCSIT